jgi:shikimate kinase
MQLLQQEKIMSNEIDLDEVVASVNDRSKRENYKEEFEKKPLEEKIKIRKATLEAFKVMDFNEDAVSKEKQKSMKQSIEDEIKEMEKRRK